MQVLVHQEHSMFQKNVAVLILSKAITFRLVLRT
jgi:hypothetical protein